MRDRYKIITIICALFLGLSVSLNAQENKKIAQTGFQFLSVTSDAKAAALGGAVTTLNMGSSSLFFNPACMTEMNYFIDVTASYTKWIANINHNTFSLAIKPADGLYGVFGVSIQAVDYGDNFFGTIVYNNEDGYLDTGELNPTAFALGFGYAKALSDRFSVGGQIRWVKQDLGSVSVPKLIQVETEVSSEYPEGVKDTTIIVKEQYDLTPFSYDFGTIFKTGFKSLTFGMSVRNFSGEIKYIKEGFQLPLVFTLGIHMDMMDFIDQSSTRHSAILAFGASHYRSHTEQLHIAVDYKFMDILSLRTGYVSNNDEDGISYGLGFSYLGLTIDYAYTPFGIFDNVQRFTARFSL